MLFSLLSWFMHLFDCFCLFNGVYHVWIDSLELNYSFLSLLCILISILFIILFNRWLLFYSLNFHLLNIVFLFCQSCLFGEKIHDWFEDEHGERVEIKILICLLWILWEIFDESGLLVGSLFFHNRLILLEVDYSILFVFLFMVLLFLLVCAEKKFNFLLYFH